MQENKDEKTTVPAQEQAACPDKPHESKRYLVFYVIGLFCVALVLILLSYITQVRADRKLNELNNRLNTQTSAVEGANARVQVLQETVEEQNARIAELNSLIAAVQETVGAQSEADVTAAADRLAKQADVLNQLLLAQESLAAGQQAAAKARLDQLVTDYGKGALDGTAESPILTGETAQLFTSLYARAEAAPAE